MNPLHVVVTACAIFCFGSFGWAAQRLFTMPEGKTPAIRRLTAAAATCIFVHIFCLLSLFFFIHSFHSLVIVAVILYTLALGLFWWAVYTTVKKPLSWAFSSDSPQHLVMSGPYRWVRHPFYTSYLSAWIAGVLATQQWWLAASVAVMFWFYWSAAKSEEIKFSSSPLASEYIAYATRTGRFLPKIM